MKNSQNTKPVFLENNIMNDMKQKCTYSCRRLYFTKQPSKIIVKIVLTAKATARPIVPSVVAKSLSLATVAAGSPSKKEDNQIIIVTLFKVTVSVVSPCR